MTSAAWRLAGAFAAMLLATATPVATAADVPPAVQAARSQQQRWIAAFNGWRTAPRDAARAEPEADAERRREMRLLLLPTATPLLGVQRRLDGSAILVSAGLVAVVEELLLAEAVTGTTSACFDRYAAQVATRVALNRSALAQHPAPPLRASPRFADMVDGSKPGRPCAGLVLRSAAATARAAAAADALLGWLFTWQHRRLLAGASAPPPAAPPLRTAAWLLAQHEVLGSWSD